MQFSTWIVSYEIFCASASSGKGKIPSLMFRHMVKTVSRISALHHTAGSPVWRHISVVLLRRGALSCHVIRLISILRRLAVVISGTLLAVAVWLCRLVTVLRLPSGSRIAAALQLAGLLVSIWGLITALGAIVVLISTLSIAILRHTARPAGIGSAVICLCRRCKLPVLDVDTGAGIWMPLVFPFLMDKGMQFQVPLDDQSGAFFDTCLDQTVRQKRIEVAGIEYGLRLSILSPLGAGDVQSRIGGASILCLHDLRIRGWSPW